MLPAIGSVSGLAGQGRVGVVVSAQPISEPENGRQLVALRIRETERVQSGQRNDGVDAAGPAGTGPQAAQLAGRPETGPRSAKLPDELSPSERADVAKLQQRDQQVRQEEKAHAAVAGDLAGPINYVYQRGPDGRQYAVGGSVSLQAGNPSGDPEQARRLAGRMAAAANAATNPSAQDYAAARQAYAFGSQLGEPTRPEDRRQGVDLEL